MMPRDISHSTTIVASPNLLVTEFGDELVLLDLRDGVYYGLEGVGARIWKLLQEPITMAAICNTLTSEYDVARADCEPDVRRLLGDLAAKGLAEIKEDA